MNATLGNFLITNDDLRPCIVDNKKAVFHKWVNIERVIFKPNGLFNNERLDYALKLYKTKQVVMQCFEVDKINVVGALIEFEDGTVKEVEVSHVKFLDSKKLFIEYDFNTKRRNANV